MLNKEFINEIRVGRRASYKQKKDCKFKSFFTAIYYSCYDILEK